MLIELRERDMLEYYKFKVVYDLFMKGQEAEAKEQLTELQRKYVTLCDDNTTLKLQVQEYEDILYLARNLFFHEGSYWLTTGSTKQGPFCAKCYERDGLLVRLSGEGAERHCSSCRTPYPAPEPEIAEELLANSGIYAEIAQQEVHRAKIIPFAK